MTPRNGALAACLAIGLGLLSVAAATPDPPGPVPFPDGYRRWALVKSALIGPQSPAFETNGGLHHVYANAQALEGFRLGRFPEDAVLAFELLATTEKDGVTSEGARKRLDVMAKVGDARAASGGWAFERFLGDSRAGTLSAEAAAACGACHARRKERDFVFSELRP